VEPTAVVNREMTADRTRFDAARALKVDCVTAEVDSALDVATNVPAAVRFVRRRSRSQDRQTNP
jgi:hypothetical protein